MIIKRISAALAAAVIMLSCALCVSAEAQWSYDEQPPQENEASEENQYTVTEEPAVTDWQTETSVTTQTTTYVPEEPTLQPTKIFLEIGEVKNQRFSAKLNISSEIAVSGAAISIDYDSDLLELKSSEINSAEIEGIPVEDSTDGKYTFTYVNTMGTDFSGTYSTLNFRIKDTSMTSCVLYVTVESLEDINLLSIPNVSENGIVNYKKAEPANADISMPDETEKKKISVLMSEKPVSLEELGITDEKSVTVSDNQTAYVEDGKLFMLAVGTTDLIVSFDDGEKAVYTVEITDPEAASSASENTDKKNINSSHEDNDNEMSIAIIIAIATALGAIAIEYVVIMKPFGNGKKTNPTVYKQDTEDSDEELSEPEEDSESVDSNDEEQAEDNE